MASEAKPRCGQDVGRVEMLAGMIPLTNDNEQSTDGEMPDLGIFVQITFMSARFLIDFLLGTILEGLRFECPLFFDNAMFAGSFVFGVLFPQPFLRTRLLHFSLTKFTLEGSYTAASKG